MVWIDWFWLSASLLIPVRCFKLYVLHTTKRNKLILQPLFHYSYDAAVLGHHTHCTMRLYPPFSNCKNTQSNNKAIDDNRLSLGDQLSCRLQGALCENTSSTKVTGTVLALYCHQRTTEPWPQVMYRKFCEVCTHGFWHMQADRPTDRYADTLTAILCTPGDKVTSHNRQANKHLQTRNESYINYSIYQSWQRRS